MDCDGVSAICQVLCQVLNIHYPSSYTKLVYIIIITVLQTRKYYQEKCIAVIY